RRSSRSVCANFVECYRRRDYKKHFVSKLSDCLAENSDTGLWLEFSRDLGFLTNELYETLKIQNEEVGRLLNFMIHNPEKFVWKS
ncbi:MAG: four helix bundle protein, partial [Chitinophagaceae bacterium]